ncbi:MAG: hypothetical protein ACP5MK_02450 [Candidatus Micrarchaeia archaeon]
MSDHIIAKQKIGIDLDGLLLNTVNQALAKVSRSDNARGIGVYKNFMYAVSIAFGAGGSLADVSSRESIARQIRKDFSELIRKTADVADYSIITARNDHIEDIRDVLRSEGIKIDIKVRSNGEKTRENGIKIHIDDNPIVFVSNGHALGVLFVTDYNNYMSKLFSVLYKILGKEVKLAHSVEEIERIVRAFAGQG